MWQTTMRRKARFEYFVDIIDLDGNPQLLPPATCDVEHHHTFVTLRFGSDDPRTIRISHQRFNSLIGTRQVAYLSWWWH